MNEVAMMIIIYEIWMKSFMPCRARMMIVSTRHLGLNLRVRKPKLVLEHCTWMEIGVNRTKKCNNNNGQQIFY